MTLEEQWKDVNGFEGIYQVSNMGRVKNIKTNKYINGGINSDGYFTIILNNKGKQKTYKIHRLVAEHFLKEPIIQVNHKNGIKTDNRASNLEYITLHENILHAWANKLARAKYGEYGNRARAIIQLDKNNLSEIARYNSIWEASEKTKIIYTSIVNCLKGRSKSGGGFKWKYAD